MLAMEKDFDSMLRIQSNSSSDGSVQRSQSIPFRAPQENCTIQDFELGKIYGVGSYSKVLSAVILVVLFLLGCASVGVGVALFLFLPVFLGNASMHA